MTTIAVAMSGGVDSLFAAHLLARKSPHAVFGIHFHSGYDDTPPDRLRELADRIGIALHTVDLRAEFEDRVVRYFIRTYAGGRTPNPCLVCNPLIKFGVLLQKAEEMGARFLATGHYARIVRDDTGGCRLLRGVDREKDQSYFLARLTPHQLSQACFPLGEMRKSDVRRLAAESGLEPLERRESQDICFINGHYSTFLRDRGVHCGHAGPVVDRTGRRIGTHQGLHRFTIGQRRGINIPGAAPYYVVGLDTSANRLVVGGKSDLYASRCRVEGINWIRRPPAAPIPVSVRLRYRHTAVDALFHPDAPERGTVLFDRPQSAVTPGQGAVFYQGEEVLGGGWISA